jgi:hypothetical protein
MFVANTCREYLVLHKMKEMKTIGAMMIWIMAK